MSETPKKKLETATLASGCFWCTEAVFKIVKGVEKIEPGYTGGSKENPSYEEVTGGRTGHAEAVQLTFDPNVISFREILEIFFAISSSFLHGVNVEIIPDASSASMVLGNSALNASRRAY